MRGECYYAEEATARPPLISGTAAAEGAADPQHQARGLEG